MNIQDLFTHYNLGEIQEEVKKVTGGLMHSMYYVNSSTGKYALKRLNPEIMKRPNVLKKVRVSETIGQVFNDHVSVIPAININGSPVFHYKDHDYILFNWLEGQSVFPPNITSKHAEIMGDILGIIHTQHIELKDISKETIAIETYDWDRYLELGKMNKRSWLANLEGIIDNLKIWNKKLIKANDSLSKNLVISHRDLDPKNVMWQNLKPYLIDWEAAGYVNPYQELLEMLNYWSDTGKGSLNKASFMAMYKAYKKYDDCMKADWDQVIISGYAGMLGWLNYSFKRALGIEAENEEERGLGEDQIISTIKALKNYTENTKTLIQWLHK